VKKALGDKAPVDSWALVFNPANISKLKSCGVSFLDRGRRVRGDAALHGPRSEQQEPGDYQAAFEVLKKVRPYITQFNSSGYINDLANGDVCLRGWSGDVGIAKRRAVEAKRRTTSSSRSRRKAAAVVRRDGNPEGCEAPEAALKWINYMSDAKVNAAITNTVFYPTANKAAHQFVRRPSRRTRPSIRRRTC
jgi:putrescine transport system substrate-binding protein